MGARCFLVSLFTVDLLPNAMSFLGGCLGSRFALRTVLVVLDVIELKMIIC